MIICITGAEGSGKGTQADLLAQKLGLPHLIMGRLIDAKAQEQSAVGEKIREVRSSGQYLPNEMVTAILFERLLEADCAEGFILDGFPRHEAQAKEMDAFLAKTDKALDLLLVLELPKEESVKRLLARGRFDDTPENIEGRLANYYKNAAALLEHYKDRGIIEKINGNETIEAVHETIMDRVKAHG